MRYLSVCSGIEAATVAWHPLGWTPVAFSEIEAFPRAVLARRFPSVPLHGDFTTIEGDEYGPVDLLVGGTPCQSFSVAGLRKGLADDRGNLALQFLALARRTGARWVLWENVPGVLSSNGGRDFGAFLGGLAELGYGWAYRVLDAQHFGVPQRRRRVFVVGYLGDWRRAAAVLFERASLQGHPPPSREAGQGIARPVTPGSPGGSGYRNDADTADNLIADTLTVGANQTTGLIGEAVAPTLTSNPYGDHESREGLLVARTLNAKGGSGRIDGESETFITHSLRADGFDASEDGTGRGTPLVTAFYPTDGRDFSGYDNVSPPVKVGSGGTCGNPPAIAFSSKDHGADAGDLALTLRAMGHDGSHANAGGQVAVAFGAFTDNGAKARGIGYSENTAPTLGAETGTNSRAAKVHLASSVRRLTPCECERLQGFPDDWTLVPYRGKPAADGPRYKAIGNSMAVPVIRWLGERIAAVEAFDRAIAIPTPRDDAKTEGRACISVLRPSPFFSFVSPSISSPEESTRRHGGT